jgi:hypothetical protein
MELSDLLLYVRLVLFVRDAVDSGTSVLSKTPECLIQRSDRDQVRDRVELPFWIFLGEFSYSVDVCEHIVSSSVSRYVSFPQIRSLASPFPPVGSVAAPCGSPAVPHFHRYYRVVRLLQHPSVLPPVNPWLHVPHTPLSEAVLLVYEEMGSSLRFLGHPCGACPGLETPASLRDLAITVAARYSLPLAQPRRPRNDTGFRG